MLQLLPRQEAERHPVKTRWGWLLLSLSFLGLAGFFLYPSLESFTEPQEARPASRSEPAPPPAAKLALPPRVRPVKTVATTAIPAKPIRELAPVAGDGIRNRIVGEIPVYVTMRIGRNGSVVSAQAATQGDGIQSYLAQRALEAVRQWKFRPARIGPDTIASNWTVRFRFEKSGVSWN